MPNWTHPGANYLYDLYASTVPVYSHILSIWALTKFHMLQWIEPICIMYKYDLGFSSYVIVVDSMKNNEAKKPFMYLIILTTSFSYY